MINCNLIDSKYGLNFKIILFYNEICIIFLKGRKKVIKKKINNKKKKNKFKVERFVKVKVEIQMI